MTRLIDPSLQELSEIMSGMGDAVIECVALAIDSYVDGTNTKERVLELSDSIRTRYYEVEDLTFDMLLKYQPVADDFRMIRSSTEISYAFSRFGRYAYDITLVRDLFGDVTECTNATLIESCKKVKAMIRDAVMCFADLDVRKAAKIREDEKQIDKIYNRRLPDLIKSSDTRCALAEALLLRYLERIGDHAVFMSDAVNYIVTGKHRPSEERIASHTKE
ncbi:MAG: phosphate uptake regulator PhoU [Nitrosopumilus sp.]|nr:phosphate uptake regulator PhoU [Nitrosopumilus sp.]CAI9831650.1 Phosphate uptake regulator, PhoU [Nitrosopumilaceae archaeon]MDA7940682.1 phosphate uptake regulator PhoU [Nitrosopumilus sp.]MDA7942890.1 phosphate uptake regulator PhoU [Nitrosopumilus sp.]MDA7945323.1 phosphate uptake regulator PhoU [Nitrosopumilus sp.]